MVKSHLTKSVLLIASVLIVQACSDSSDPGKLTFDVEQDVSEQTITGDPGSAGNPLATSVTVQMPDITQEPEYQAQVFKLVDVVASADLTLTIAPTSPQPDFSFVDSLSVWVGPVGGGPGMQRIAFLDPGDPQLAPGSTTIQLQTTNVDVKGLIDMGVYELRVDVQGTTLPDDVIFDGQVLFEITVELF